MTAALESSPPGELEKAGVDHLVECNSPQLLAYRLIGMEIELRRRSDEYQRDRDQWRNTMTAAEAIGLQVMRLRHQGRKTIRVDEVAG